MDYSDKFNETGKEQVNSEKIFKIFHTLSPCDGVESTDIGLSIVKKLVELNNGKVWVDSEVGQGSTFFFTMPKQGSDTTAISANTHNQENDHSVKANGAKYHTQKND